MKKILFSAILLVFALVTVSSQTNPVDLTGKWTGTLDVQSTKLRVVFNLKQENGIVSATLESPDQGTMIIPVQEVIVKDSSIVIEVPSVNGQYKGSIVSEKSIEGFWSQNGSSLPLDITKEKNVTGE